MGDVAEGPAFAPFYRAWEESVSQGDFFELLVVYRADSAPRRVAKRTERGGGTVWEAADDGAFAVLPVMQLPVLILSHDCAIDKLTNAAGNPTEMSAAEARRRSSKTDVLGSPVRPVPNTWDDAKLHAVAQGGVIHQFLLPPEESIAWVGGYVDFRWVVTFRLNELQSAPRRARLGEHQVALLQRRVTNFLAWRELGLGT